MQELNIKELKKVKGGISFMTIILSITGAIFAAGLIDGIARPFGCR